MKRTLVFGCLLAGLAAFGLPMLAQDKKPEGQPPAGEQPSKEMQEMMAAWAKLATPGEHHRHLKPMAGKWDIAWKFRMAPEAPWTESKSTADSEWILGERFLCTKVKGEAMPGMPGPFEGLGILGHDNQKQKYVSVWMDNMGTMIITAEGTCDASGRTITFKSEYFDPMTNKDTWMKSVYKIESPSRYVLSMSGPGEDDKEFVSMELVCTRK